jgi:uncharacterized OsmC-like protein
LSILSAERHFDLETSANEEQLATLLKLTERYCVVYQALANATEVKILREWGEG